VQVPEPTYNLSEDFYTVNFGFYAPYYYLTSEDLINCPIVAEFDKEKFNWDDLFDELNLFRIETSSSKRNDFTLEGCPDTWEIQRTSDSTILSGICEGYALTGYTKEELQNYSGTFLIKYKGTPFMKVVVF